MKKRKILTIALAVFLAVAMFLAGFFSEMIFCGGKYSELEWMIDKIDAHYMELDENGNVREFTAEDYINIIDNGKKLKADNYGLLDRYSEYYTKEEYNEVLSSKEGNATGIGVTLDSNGNGLTVRQVAFNSPLDKAQMAYGVDLRGKSITKINGVAVSDRTALNTEIVKYSNGQDFTIEFDETITLTVKSVAYVQSYFKYFDSDSAIVFSSEYGYKPVKEIIDSGASLYALPQDTAYIIFNHFNGNAVEEFKIIMEYLKQKGKKKVILDLRDNGGGYMDILCDVASYLMKGTAKNKLVTAVKYKDGKIDEYKTGANNYVPIDKLTVIANENSASASECLIGALLVNGDLKKENLIVTNSTGTSYKTYGKGIMQTTFTSSKGTAIKLTTAYVYWPDKTTNIHGKGIVANSGNGVSFTNGLSRALEVNNA